MADDLDILTRTAVVEPPNPPPAAHDPLDLLLVLPRFGAGGASKAACVLASELAGSGLAVGLATLGEPAGVTRAHLSDRVGTYPLPDGGREGRGPPAVLAALPALVRLLHQRRPAVLLSAGNHANLMTALAHQLGARPGTGLVLKITNPIRRAGRGALRQALKAAVYRWMFRRASAVLTLSAEDTAEVLALAPWAAGKVRVVANPYLGRSALELPPAPHGTGTPLILAVGRLTEQKNFELLLTALSRLQARPWRLRVLGSGADLGRLQALARDLGLADRTEFLGYVAEPVPHYAEAQVLAISSRWEGLPAVAIEAMACGCAVVATDCSPGLSRIVRSSGVGRVARQCPMAFADALAAALDQPRPDCAPPIVFDYTYEGAALSHRRALAPLLAR